MTPEQRARRKIDRLLKAAGWQFSTEVHAPGAQRDGFADYVLSDSAGVKWALLEAKAASKHPLAGKEQARDYANSALGIQYVILSNGEEHYCWDPREGNPFRVLAIPSPAKVKRQLEGPAGDRSLLGQTVVGADYLPAAAGRVMRPYQWEAVAAVQRAAEQGETTFLLEMATGTGKTTVAAALCYLYLVTGNAERIMFLVDRIELKDQTGPDLQKALAGQYTVGIYNGQGDYDWARTHISVVSIQSLEGLGLPAEHFDLIITDEAHRCISGPSRRWLFDRLEGEKIGLTATPRALLNERETGEGVSDLQLEQQALRDTYFAFGRPAGEPTYSYTLEDARRDGYLVGPTAVDVRTELTRQLLAEGGVELDVISLDGRVAVTRPFEAGNLGRNLFSPATRREFAETIIAEALREPETGLMGKTIVYTPSQREALELTEVINAAAMERWPGVYQSDFAVAIVSGVDQAAEFGRQFRNNDLKGNHPRAAGRHTSKTRVCVTVRMMTTGYDCPDLLNIVLCGKMDSPTEFIQVKGRGTRKFDFRENVTDAVVRREMPPYPKEQFKIIDFFGVCARHHEGHLYEPRLGGPREETEDIGPGEDGARREEGGGGGQFIYTGADQTESQTELEFEADARTILERRDTQESYELRQSFNRYLAAHPIADPGIQENARQLFEAYATDAAVRAAVDGRQPGRLLDTGLSQQVYQAVPREVREQIAAYIRDNLPAAEPAGGEGGE